MSKEKDFVDRFKEAKKARPNLSMPEFRKEEEQKQFSESVEDTFGGTLPYLEDEQVFILDYFLYNYKKFEVESVPTPQVETVPDKENLQGFLNRLSIPDDFEKLVDIRPSDYARLTPSYEIFKVLYDGGNISDEIPFIFSNLSDLSGLYDQSATFRGHGAGIKSATVTLDGKNNVLSHMVSLKLTLMFQDINTIWAVAANGASYVDLFSYPNKDNEQYYRIKMLLGYNGYADTSLGDISLRYSKLMMLLDYKTHTIEVNENGTCKVVIDYVGALEFVFTDPAVANIVFETPEERRVNRENNDKIKEITDRAAKIEAADITRLKNTSINKLRENADFAISLLPDEAIIKSEEEKIRQRTAELKKDVDEEINQIKKQFLASRMERLLEIFRKKLTIFQVGLTTEDIAGYRQWLGSGTIRMATSSALQKPFYRITNTGNIEAGLSGGPIGAINEAVKDDNAVREAKSAVENTFGIKPDASNQVSVGERTVEALTAQFNQDSFQHRIISFVLLKDLLSAILEAINPLIAEKYGRNFKILFGNVVFQPANSDNAVSMNIGDIPVSLTKLNYFLVDKLIGKGITVYTFQQFFEDLFNDFFVRATENAMKMRSVDSNEKRMKNSFNLDYLQIYEKGGKYTVLQDGTGGAVNEVLFIYGNSVGSVETFDFAKNIENGIPHMFFGGVDRGIVKKIKFADNTNAKSKAAIWEQNRGDNSGDDLSKYGGTLTPLVYNADATLIGYPYIINGNTIFIDTAALGLDQGKAVNLLLGGYYLVTKVVHDLTIDKFETKISAILVADYRLKGKISEQVNIVSAADFNKTFAESVYDIEQMKIDESRAASERKADELLARKAFEKQRSLERTIERGAEQNAALALPRRDR